MGRCSLARTRAQLGSATQNAQGGARLCWGVCAPEQPAGSVAPAGWSGRLSTCTGRRSADEQPAAFAWRVREVRCCSAFAAAAGVPHPAALGGLGRALAAKVAAIGHGPRVRLAGAADAQAPRNPARQRPALTGHLPKTSRGLACPRAARALAAGRARRARLETMSMFRPVARLLTSASAAAGRLCTIQSGLLRLCAQLVPADARPARAAGQRCHVAKVGPRWDQFFSWRVWGLTRRGKTPPGIGNGD